MYKQADILRYPGSNGYVRFPPVTSYAISDLRRTIHLVQDVYPTRLPTPNVLPTIL